MKVLITGGAGFIGIMLARKLLSLPDLAGPDGKRHKLDELVLFDVARGEPVRNELGFCVRCARNEIGEAITTAVIMSPFRLRRLPRRATGRVAQWDGPLRAGARQPR